MVNGRGVKELRELGKWGHPWWSEKCYVRGGRRERRDGEEQAIRIKQ